MAETKTQIIPIEKIKDLPGLTDTQQPEKSYGSLVSSILINGVKEPVILRSSENNEYQLVSGYRRMKAAELAHLKELPALVYDMSEKEAFEYRAKEKLDPKAVIPGKLIEKAKEKPVKEKKAKTIEAEEAPTGTVAVVPSGTAITKLLDSRLNPPTDKEKKDFPKPGEGEAFSVILHPGYLKKAELNRFSVDREADDFKELYKSIERFGVKDPVLARVGEDGELEIISGQRRHLIASELNYPVPTIIQQMDNDDAGILVADGNLHREHISTYDMSRALKMKAEAMKHKAGRRSKEEAAPKLYTDEVLAKEMGMSVPKLNRLIKLSEATKQICDLVDDGTMPLSIAYNVAFLPEDVQNNVADLVGVNVKVSTENTAVLKILAKTETLDYEKIRDVLEGRYPPKAEEKPEPTTQTPSMAPTAIPKSPDVPTEFKPAETTAVENRESSIPIPAAPIITNEHSEPIDRESSYETKVVLRGDRLRKYFPDVSMTPREIEDSIYSALEERRQRQAKLKQKAEITKVKER